MGAMRSAKGWQCHLSFSIYCASFLLLQTLRLKPFGFEFLVGGEPLLVSQPEELKEHYNFDCLQLDSSKLRAFSLGYVKGQGRSTSLLAILHYCWRENIEISQVHPKFYESARSIYVYHLSISTKIDEALMNMRISARGSVRRANNLITTVIMIQNLVEHGLTDPMNFVRKWGPGSTGNGIFSSEVKGSKMSA